MGIEKLELQDFRCFERLLLEAHPGTNLIVGANGSGKTSVLEALHVVGAGRSFRVRELTPLVRYECQRFGMLARLHARQTIEATGAFGGLELKLNGVPLRSTTELAGVVPVQALHPEMHALVEGPPEGRRRFLDWGAFHVKPSFLENWRRYHRALRQRNAALKQGLSGAALGVWDSELVQAGEIVHAHRSEYVAHLGRAFADMASALLGTTVELRYRSGWGEDLTLAEAVERSTHRDQLLKATQVGPHRADAQIRFGAVQARHLASRGQQKLLAVSLGLAQAEIIASTSPRQLVLLLDDPIAEVDPDRSAALVARVAVVAAQRFVTGLSRESYPGHVDRLFHVKRGELTQVI